MVRQVIKKHFLIVVAVLLTAPGGEAAAANVPAGIYVRSGSEFINVWELTEPEGRRLQRILRRRPTLTDVPGEDVTEQRFPALTGGVEAEQDFLARPSRSVPLCHNRRRQLGSLLVCLRQKEQEYTSSAAVARTLLTARVAQLNSRLPEAERVALDDIVGDTHFEASGWMSGRMEFCRTLLDKCGATGSADCRRAARLVGQSCAHFMRAQVVRTGAAAMFVHLYDHADSGSALPDYLLIASGRTPLPSGARLRASSASGSRTGPASGTSGTPGKAPSAASAAGTPGTPGAASAGDAARGGARYGHRSLRPGDGPTDPGILVSCLYGYHIPQNDFQNHWSAPQTCAAIAGSDLLPFQHELTYLMADSTVQTYFEVLRMEAISRFMRAHRELIGSDLPADPPSCGAFQRGMAEFRGTPVSTEAHARYTLTNSAGYREALVRTARLTRDMMREAAELDAVPRTHNCSHDGQTTSCEVNPAYAPAQERLTELRRLLLDNYTAFPLLSAGHPHRAEVWVDVPMVERLASADPANATAMDAVLQAGRTLLSADLAASVGKFCGTGPPDGISWGDLVRLDEITGPVTERFPQFAFVQRCARERIEDWTRTGEIMMMIAGGGCVIGTIASGGGMGPACAGLFVGAAYLEYAGARERLYWTGRCRAGGAAVCNAADYLGARTSYESAVDQLALAVAFSVIEVPVLVRQLRAAAEFMAASDLTRFASRIRAAEALTDDAARAAALRGISHDVSAATDLAAARETTRTRVVGSLGEDTARVRFPCLFR